MSRYFIHEANIEKVEDRISKIGGSATSSDVLSTMRKLAKNSEMFLKLLIRLTSRSS